MRKKNQHLIYTTETLQIKLEVASRAPLFDGHSYTTLDSVLVFFCGQWFAFLCASKL